MGMEIVTGYTGEPHIRPEDDGARNAGIFGTGKYVLNVGRKFAVEIVSNNMVKIKDGDLINQGRHIRIPVGETEECTIENGTQARYRNDLIVSRYSKESGSEGKESAKIVVIKGTASTSSTPPDPSYTSGDILNGALTDDFPLYRVRLNGLSITAVEPLFGNPVKSLSELNTDMIERSTVAEVYFDGDVTQTSNGYTNIEISGHNAEADKLLTFGTWQFYFKEAGRYLITINAVNTGDYNLAGVFGAGLGKNAIFAGDNVGFSLVPFPPNGMSRRVSSSVIIEASASEGFNMLYYVNQNGQKVEGIMQIVRL